MSTHFATADIMLIEKEITRKSFKDIAFLLDRSLDEVRYFLKKWCAENSVIPYQAILDAERASRVPVQRMQKAKKPVTRTELPKVILSVNQQEQARRLARKAREEPKFITKQVDYSKLTSVRIDHRTFIYVKPGDNVEEVKRKYLKRINDAKRLAGNEFD